MIYVAHRENLGREAALAEAAERASRMAKALARKSPNS